MKILSIQNIDLNDAYLIKEDSFGNKIYRFKLDSYAVTASHCKGAIVAFESRTFSAMLSWLQASIEDFALMHTKSMLCEDAQELFELKILTKDGRALKIDSRGEIEELTALEEHAEQEREFLSASQICHVEERFPYDRLLFSKHLAWRMIELCEICEEQEIIDRFWSEFSSQRKIDGARKIHGLIGDFCAFSVAELPCGRFVFLTAEEGLLVADMEGPEE
jgi:hypothetical protein